MSISTAHCCSLQFQISAKTVKYHENDFATWYTYFTLAPPLVDRLFGSDRNPAWAIEFNQIETSSNIVIVNGGNDGELA